MSRNASSLAKPHGHIIRLKHPSGSGTPSDLDASLRERRRDLAPPPLKVRLNVERRSIKSSVTVEQRTNAFRSI